LGQSSIIVFKFCSLEHRDTVASQSVAKPDLFAEENDYCSHNLDSVHVMDTGEEPLSTTELVSELQMSKVCIHMLRYTTALICLKECI